MNQKTQDTDTPKKPSDNIGIPSHTINSNSTSNYSLTHNIRKSLTIPAAIALVGLYSGHQNYTTDFIGKRTIHSEIRDNFPYFHTYADDYLQHLPLVSAYALEAMGIKGKNKTGRKTLLLIQAEIVCIGTTRLLKTISSNTRPNGQGNSSFPSGHTTQAFLAATFFHKEYGHKSPWYSIAAYSVATSVGCMRMLNNVHWFSDVMVGAAIGIGGTNLVYTFSEHKKQKSNSLITVPLVGKNLYGATLAYTF